MPRLLSHSVNALTLSLITLLLSSCGSPNTTTLYPLPASEIASPVSPLSQDPELLLVEAEPEQCLSEELEALKQTGAWQPEKPVAGQDASKTTTYDFPIVINKQVEMYLDLFQNRQKKQFALWLSRSGRYLPMFRKELREAGLPQDLAYLAMIESGFNQRAYSRARAVGLWQFIKGTGRHYNLEINRYVDERRHAEKSTKAAIAFLSDLYADFGDWHLAVAAYNAGPGKIKRGLKRFKSQDFWSLAQHRYLRLETKRYVPKLIAAILIAKNPEKYGFGDVTYETPLEYETLRVGPGLSLEAVSLLCGANAKEIKRLNQELKTGKTPLNKSHYEVQIPMGTKEVAEANLPRLHSVVSTGYKTHIIAKGETLSQICRRYNINKTTLLKINDLHSSTLVVGNHLRIPYSTIHHRLLPEGQEGTLAADDLILHTIKPGETISKIARKYHIPADLIISWNGLKNAHRIRAGQQLALYIEDLRNGSRPQKTVAAAAAPVKKASIRTASLITLGEQKKFSVKQTDAGKQQVSWYRVRRGDSLWAIARKFNLSTEQLKSWNNLKSNRIHPGIKLIIKKV